MLVDDKDVLVMVRFANRLGFRTNFLACLGLCGLLTGATGCRLPAPRGVSSSEPSFDRLLELEDEEEVGAASHLSSRQRRPGYDSTESSQNLASRSGSSINSTMQSRFGEQESSDEDYDYAGGSLTDRTNYEDEARMLASDQAEGVPPQVSEMLDRTEQALRNQKKQRAQELESMASASRRASNSSARRTISDSTTNSPTVDEPIESDDQISLASGELNSNTKAPIVPASFASTERPVIDREVLEEDIVEQSSPVKVDLTWQEHVQAAIAQLSEVKHDTTVSPDEQTRLAALSRLLSVSLGDYESAMTAIEGLQKDEQDYFRHQFKALYEATNPEGNPVASRRWSLTMLSQRRALEHLAAVSNLEVNSVAFCTDVEGFGVINRFANYEFKPDQEVLLYCEVDNFVCEEIQKGYETQLQGSYEIVDSNGRRVADQLLPTDSHTCRNRRRDYFIAYRIYMPQNIDSGKYTLKLVIEDMKGHKFGQSEVNFQIAN